MAYSTPAYNFANQQNQATQQYGLQSAANDFGRFVSQQRHKRTVDDMGRGFQQNFPRVGSSFNRRGLWNSGLRREGQREATNDYQRALNRVHADQAATDTHFQNNQTMLDSGFQQQLLSMFEQMKSGQAAGYDPFAALRDMISRGWQG